MARHPEICFLWQNQPTTHKQHRENLIALQALAFGLFVGIGVRIVWDHGMIVAFAQTLESVAVSIWIMIRDVASASGDFVQYVLRAANH